MKTYISKFIPGVALSIAVIVLGAFVAHAQQSTPAAAPAPQVQAVQQPHPSADSGQGPQTIIVCGNCGAQIGQPQTVLVAPPIYQQQAIAGCGIDRPVGLVQGFDGSYYFTDGRIPPSPVFSLTDYWRADPRLIVPQRRFVHGSAPVRRFRH